MFFLLTLPFRIALGLLLLPFVLLFLPFLLLRLVIKSVVFLVVLPFALLTVGAALLMAFIALVCVLTIPLLPFAFIALFIWAVARSTRPALTSNF
jgi:hypothetical protein